MDSQYEAGKLLETSEALKLQFILLELDLALTFCTVASTTESQETRQRNLSNARRAYQMAASKVNNARVTADLREEIGNRLARLEHSLAEFGGV
jgi:hypothetical protein